MRKALSLLAICGIAFGSSLGSPGAQARSAVMVPAALDLAAARVLAQNLIGADIDDDGHLVFGTADQDLAPAMRLRRDFWVVEVVLFVFCLILGGGQSAIAKWARIVRLVVVLLGVSLTFWTIATLMPVLAAPAVPG